jgi:Domain of unknown function (DUF4349)
MKSSIVVLLMAMLCACANNAEKSEALAMQVNETAAKSVLAGQTKPLPDVDNNNATNVIKIADYRFKVKDLNKSLQSIEVLVKKYPAQIVSSNLETSGKILENTMTIRVESKYFNDLLREIDKEAVIVHNRNIRTEDVGKQFVDLESRLRTKREVQERYKEILRRKAGTIEELLLAEKQIGELQEEIEATISRVNYLRDQVSLSTINLNFYTELDDDLSAADDNGIGKRIAAAGAIGLNGLIEITIGLVSIWPLCLFLGIVFILIRRKIRLRPVSN